MIESVKKAQQEASAALLSRALQMCRAKQVTHITFHTYNSINMLVAYNTEAYNHNLVSDCYNYGRDSNGFLCYPIHMDM